MLQLKKIDIPTAIEIFGRPNPATLEKMLSITGAGIEVTIHPYDAGGFMRWMEPWVS